MIVCRKCGRSIPSGVVYVKRGDKSICKECYDREPK